MGVDISFGKFYFSERRAEYGSADDPEKVINVVDESVPSDPRVDEALEGLFEKTRVFEPILVLLTTLGLCNQTTLVGMYRAALMVNPFHYFGWDELRDVGA